MATPNRSHIIAIDPSQDAVAEIVQRFDLVKPGDIITNAAFDYGSLDLANSGNGDIALKL